MDNYMGIIREDTMDKDIERFFQFDKDVTGQNGEMYTVPEAVERNMTSLEYYIMLAEQIELKGEERINFICREVKDSYTSDEKVGFKILNTEQGEYVVSFVII